MVVKAQRLSEEKGREQLQRQLVDVVDSVAVNRYSNCTLTSRRVRSVCNVLGQMGVRRRPSQPSTLKPQDWVEFGKKRTA
jgi:hypothetical protein